MEPDGPTEATETGGLIDRLGTKGVVAIVVAAVAIIAILGSGLGSDDETVVISVPATAPPQAAPSTATPEGPQVAPIDTCTLLPDDAVDQALGLVDDEGSFRPSSMLVFELGETCRWEAEINETGEEVSMELGPGAESDFASDTEVDGVTATTQPGVGDLAVWYPGDGTGTMSAVQETADGWLFVKLSINRPEADDATRRELAVELMSTAIERIRTGPPPPIEVDLCELVSDEDAERVLAPHREDRAAARSEVMGGGSPKVEDISQPGETFCQKLILAEIYVVAAMASDSDFEPNAQIDGVDGRPISGVGDEAMWFEDVAGRGNIASPHDTDILAVRSGEAMFRIIIALPDLEPGEQLDTATSLAVEALTRLPGSEGEDIDENQETPDLEDVPCPDFCGPSDYYHYLEQLAEWFRQLVGR